MRREAIYLAIGIIGFILLIGAFLIVMPSPVRAGCEVEPASEWAPAGYICPPLYGEGTASTWGGPGVARNDCVFPWTACAPIRITSLATGRSIDVTPTMWCHCWTLVTGPAGETRRIADLDDEALLALGLNTPDGLPIHGLHRVRVDPIGVRISPTEQKLPDTAVTP